MHSPQTGFTLTELLTALMIASILVATGAPALSASRDKARANHTTQNALHAIQHARTLAIHHQSGVITLCGSSDGHACSNDWSQGWILFADDNNNHRWDADEPLHQKDQHSLDGQLRWRGSAGRPYLRFTAVGYAMEFGSLTYCAPDHDPRHARQITINRPGRARLSRDRNGDGIHEDSYDKPLDCAS
ncbi:MAG TPA: GspH/FimT family pseudopilin [Pseudomonadales bacterium]|jgi:type IV fimbrial biogenesis protein FimT